MNVAVTGASGHLGANLVRHLLREGHRITVLAFEHSPALDGLDVREVPGNVLDPASIEKTFEGADAVYHLAAMITLRWRRDPAAHRVNVEGTRNVVEACRKCGVSRLIHFSSIHAFSTHPRQEPIDEDRPLGLAARALPYDRSKAAAELIVRNALREGLDAIILNPTGIIGPHDYEPSAMGRVLLDLQAGRISALLRGGFNWVDARDVAEASVHAATSAARGTRYILGGTYASLVELAEIVSRLAGTAAPRFTVPLWTAYCGVPFAGLRACGTKLKPRMTLAALHALGNHQEVTHQKAEQELGYAPRPLETTIADTLQWFADRSPASQPRTITAQDAFPPPPSQLR